jgi:hypothetical protein
MASDHWDLWYQLGRQASGVVPVAWLVFRLQIHLFAWSQANVDSANPVSWPAGAIADAVLAFPLFYVPALERWFIGREGRYDLLSHMAANALCWECLLAPFISRRWRRLLSAAVALTDALWPD